LILKLVKIVILNYFSNPRQKYGVLFTPTIVFEGVRKKQGYIFSAEAQPRICIVKQIEGSARKE